MLGKRKSEGISPNASYTASNTLSQDYLSSFKLQVLAISTEPLSLPYQETSLPDIHNSARGSSWKLAEQIIPEEGGSTVGGSRESSASNSRSLQTLQYDLTNLTQYGNTDMDQTYKNSVISGIEYFERKNWELKELNNRVLRELERVLRLNHELEETIRKLMEDNQMMDVSVDEYKIKHDLVEKENSKLQEQAMSQWSSRIKAEEMHAEDQRDAKQEVIRMRQELQEKNEEIKRILAQQEALKGKQKDSSTAEKSKSSTGTSSKSHASSNAGDNFELLHKISRLEDDILKIRSEKDGVTDTNKRLKLELDTLKSKSQQQGAELETQYKRFLSLKKNFNDLLDENEKLKGRMRSRRDSNPSISNQTWPMQPRTNPDNGGKDVLDGGSLRLVDIPLKAGKQPISAFSSGLPKAGSQARRKAIVGGRHHRNGSEVRSLPDSLPPMPT